VNCLFQMAVQTAPRIPCLSVFVAGKAPSARASAPNHPRTVAASIAFTSTHGMVVRVGVAGAGSQPIRQAATSTAISSSVFQPERPRTTSTTSPTSTSRDGFGTLFVIGMKCVISASGNVLQLVRSLSFGVGYLRTHTPSHAPSRLPPDSLFRTPISLPLLPPRVSLATRASSPRTTTANLSARCSSSTRPPSSA
jgi:hypothetical protein